MIDFALCADIDVIRNNQVVCLNMASATDRCRNTWAAVYHHLRALSIRRARFPGGRFRIGQCDARWRKEAVHESAAQTHESSIATIHAFAASFVDGPVLPFTAPRPTREGSRVLSPRLAADVPGEPRSVSHRCSLHQIHLPGTGLQKADAQSHGLPAERARSCQACVHSPAASGIWA